MSTNETALAYREQINSIVKSSLDFENLPDFVTEAIFEAVHTLQLMPLTDQELSKLFTSLAEHHKGLIDEAVVQPSDR